MLRKMYGEYTCTLNAPLLSGYFLERRERERFRSSASQPARCSRTNSTPENSRVVDLEVEFETLLVRHDKRVLNTKIVWVVGVDDGKFGRFEVCGRGIIKW